MYDSKSDPRYQDKVPPAPDQEDQLLKKIEEETKNKTSDPISQKIVRAYFGKQKKEDETNG